MRIDTDATFIQWNTDDSERTDLVANCPLTDDLDLHVSIESMHVMIMGLSNENWDETGIEEWNKWLLQNLTDRLRIFIQIHIFENIIKKYKTSVENCFNHQVS